MFNFLKNNKKDVKEYLKDYRQTQSSNSLRDNQTMRMPVAPDFDTYSLVPRGPYIDKSLRYSQQQMRYSQVIEKPPIHSPQNQFPQYPMYGYVPQQQYVYYPYGQQPPIQNEITYVKETKEDDDEEEIKPKIKKQNDKIEQKKYVVNYAKAEIEKEKKQEEPEELDFNSLMAPFIKAIEDDPRSREEKISLGCRIRYITKRGIDTCTQLLDVEPQLQSCCQKLKMESCMETHNTIMSKLMAIQNNIQKFVLP